MLVALTPWVCRPASTDSSVREAAHCGARRGCSAWLLTGDHQLAEDLVQTALAKSWGAFDRVGVDGFEAYVRRVMFTTYISWWRRKWRGERPTEAQAAGVLGISVGTVKSQCSRALTALRSSPRLRREESPDE